MPNKIVGTRLRALTATREAFLLKQKRVEEREKAMISTRTILPMVAAALLASTSIASAQVEASVGSDGVSASADVGGASVGGGGVDASAGVGSGSSASAGVAGADASIGGTSGGGSGANADVGFGGLFGGTTGTVDANLGGTAPTSANVSLGSGALGGTTGNANATVGGVTSGAPAGAATASLGIGGTPGSGAPATSGPLGGLGAALGSIFGGAPAAPGTGTGTGTGTGAAGFGSLAGLSSSGIGASFAMMSPRDQARITRRCSSIMKNPRGFDRESVAVCRVIAAR